MALIMAFSKTLMTKIKNLDLCGLYVNLSIHLTINTFQGFK